MLSVTVIIVFTCIIYIRFYNKTIYRSTSQYEKQVHTNISGTCSFESVWQSFQQIHMDG